MGDADDEHDEFAIEHLVHHPVVADSDASQPLKAAFEAGAYVRLVGELVDCGDDSPTLRMGDAGRVRVRRCA